MRDRKLSREQAIEEYLIYHIRLFEFLHVFQMTLDLMEEKYRPENLLGHSSRDFFGTLRSLSYGLFASLIDAQNSALDIFDVWVVLFPDHEDEIRATWQKVEPYIPLVREYRNDVAFHANKDLRRYFETRGRFREQRKEIVAAMQAFWGLAAKLIKNQGAALPDFRSEIEPPLKKAFPGKTPQELESLKNYFIQN